MYYNECSHPSHHALSLVKPKTRNRGHTFVRNNLLHIKKYLVFVIITIIPAIVTIL